MQAVIIYKQNIGIRKERWNCAAKNEIKKPSYTYEADRDNAWTFYNHVTHALKKSHPRSWMTDQQKFHEFMITELLSQSQLQNTDANIIDEIDPRQLNIIDAIENKSFTADMEAQDDMFGEFKIWVMSDGV